jgi:hypothetical protein
VNLAIARALFGARAQVVVGALCLVVGIAAWVYGSTLHGEQLLAFVFHISMFFGCVACYAIIATGLGYRATERVESNMPTTE